MLDLITVREAARQCRRATETVRRWIWEGKLPAQKLGNQLFIKRSDVTHFMRRRRGREASDELDALRDVEAIRERIRRAIGGSTMDVLGALDRSRESHP